MSGGEWEYFGWRNPLGGKCLKNGHRKFGVPGNVILQKKTFRGKCLKKGHRKFGVPGYVILQKYL